MAETLGEALLVLRTDDRGLDTGMAKAKAGAEGVGASFDRAKASTDKLSQGLQGTGRAATTTGQQLQQVTTASGAQRAGMQQLSQQIGDVATQYALGQRPAQIFAAQIGQITQAIQLATGGTSKLANFLSGPWGLALIVATQLLGPFVAKLFEAKQAAELAATGANALETAQSSLANVFDLVSGKLKTQNELLILNARLTAINLRATAIQKRQSAGQAFQGAGKGTPTILESFALSDPEAGATFAGKANAERLRELVAGLKAAQAGARTEAERAAASDVALRASNKLDFTGVGVTREKFQQAIIDSATAELNDRAAALIDKSLDSGQLAPELRNPARPGRTRKGPKDRSAAIAEQQAQDLARLAEEELRAKLDLTTDVIERATIQRELLALERAERIRQIEADKNLSSAQRAARIAAINRLYGDPAAAAASSDADVTVRPDTSLLGRRISRERDDRQFQLRNDALGRQAEALSAQASITDGLRARARLEQQALELQQQIARNLLEQEIASGRIADADAARALLAQRQGVERERLDRSNEGPLARYARGLKDNGDDIATRVEGYVVDELESVRNALRQGLTKAIGTDDPLINGLLDILIEQLVLKPLADALSQASSTSGSGGFFNSIFSAIGSLFGGGRAGGGTVAPGRIYAVNERSTTPGLFMPISAGMIQPADAPMPSAGGGSGAAPYFDLRGAVVTEDLLRQMNAISRANVRQGLAGYDNVVGSRVDDYRERRR